MLAIRDELLKNGHRCSIIATAKSSQPVTEPDVYHPRTPAALVQLLKTLDYNVLHVHVGGRINLRILAFLKVCAFFGRGKSVLTLHSGGYAVERIGTANRFSFDGFVFRLFRRIVVVNPLMFELLEKFGAKKERVRLIYPFVLRNPDKSVGVPPEFEEFAAKHRPFLLGVGLLEDDYDLFLQVDALEKVLEKLPGAGLMIVGSGSQEAEMKRAIAAKPYASRIFLAGNVPNPVTLHLIKKADILLRTTKFDGDAIAVREALFLGTPVIATDNGMRPEGVELMPVGDAAALVEKIVRIAETLPASKIERPEDRSNVEAVLKLYEEF